MKHLLLMLACVAAFCTSCSDDDEKDPKEIELKGTPTEQTLHADENGADNGIRFTAASDWTATVTELQVRSDATPTVDWLTLSAYSGGAGEHTLTMSITENRTGKARKAEISIQCGATKITVTVEQTAEKADGSLMEKAKPVKEITYREVLNSEKVNGSTDHSENFDKTFAYDEQGRVVRIETSNTQYGETWTVTHSFDYGVAGEIAITCTNSQYENEPDYYRAKLDAKGNVVTLQEKEDGTYEDYITFKYTADGRFAGWKDCDEYDPCEGKYSYTDGMLSKYEYISYKYDDENMTYNFPTATTYPNKYPNNGTIDFLGYIMMDDDYDFLFHIGRLGKSGDYLPERFPEEDGGDDYYEVSTGYPTPGEIIHKTKQYVEWPENTDAILTYEFDNDKNMTKMVVTHSFVVMEDEYDIVVGTELIDPDYPGKGYKYEIKNRTTRKVRDDQDTHTYTITY